MEARSLWKAPDVREAIQYVIGGQGEPMALFVRRIVGLGQKNCGARWIRASFRGL
jgi:hypothetical protein